MSLYKRLSQMRDRRGHDGPSRGDRGPLRRAAPRGRASSSSTRRSGCARRPSACSRWTSRAAALELRFGPEPALGPQALVALVKALPGAAVRPTGLRAPLEEAEDALAGLTRILGRLEQAARSPAL